MNDTNMEESNKDLLDVDKSYCISLKKQESKWPAILDNIHYHGFPSCEIFEGILGSTYKGTDTSSILSVWQEYILNFEETRHNHEQFTSWGGLGCYLSHCDIWKDALKKGYKKIAVFEDDVVFRDSFDKKLEKDIATVPKDFQILLMGSYRLSSTPVEDGGSRTDVAEVFRFFGTHAYIITSEAMIVLLSRAFPVEVQLDSYMSFMIKIYGIPTYDIAGICGQELHVSNIQTTCLNCPNVDTDMSNGAVSYLNFAMTHYHSIFIIILTVLIIFLISKQK